MIRMEPTANAYAAAKGGEVAVAQPAAPAVVAEIGKLPGLVKAAAEKLAKAGTAAEVLDARDDAGLAYDASKRAARMAKAKGAHDQLIAAAHRAQADALEIEAAAKRRLADEYDAAQGRGEVARSGDTLKQGPGVPEQNAGKATAQDIQIPRKQVHEARRVRDAEAASPGVVREALDASLAEGREPTRAAMNTAVDRALGKTHEPTPEPLPIEKLQAAWDRASDGERAEFLARNGLQVIPTPVQPATTYRGVRLSTDGTKFRAAISAGGRKFELGQFETAEDAARAYDKAALEKHGAGAALNFPGEVLA